MYVRGQYQVDFGELEKIPSIMIEEALELVCVVSLIQSADLI